MKKKRKFELIVSFVLLWSLSVHAQSYVKGFAGYSFSSNPEKMQSTEIISNIKTVYVSDFKYGQGTNLGLAIGYRLTNNFSLEITGGTQLFTTKQIHVPQKDLSRTGNYLLQGYFGDLKYTSHFFQFAPQIIYTVNYKKNFLFFIQTGPDFFLVKRRYQNSYKDWFMDSAGVRPFLNELEFLDKGGLNIGIRSSAGAAYQLSKNLQLMFECLLVNASYHFKTRETTKFTIDGINHLTGDRASHIQSIAEGVKVDYSNWGFNIGLKYLL